MKPYSMTIQMKASAQYFPVVLLIMLYFAFALIVRPFYL